MNRGTITQAAKDFLTEYKGDTSSATPFMWAMLVTQAANDVAKRTDCFYTSHVADLVSGTSDYAKGPVYSIKRLTVADGAGNVVVINPMRSTDFNLWGVVQGFVATTGTITPGIPNAWVDLATNLIRLAPAPNYAATGGLVVEGFGYPSLTWESLTMECPLVPESHLSVVYRAAMLRSAQFADPENLARTKQIADVYDIEIATAKALIQQNAQDTPQFGQDSATAFTGAI